MKFSSTLSLASAIAVAVASHDRLLFGRQSSNSSSDSNSTDPMYQLSTDSDYHFEILRVLGMAPFGGSDIGETLVVAKEIVPGDFDSYYTAFYNLALRVQAEADAIDRTLYPVSARYAYFRAASYYRSADFYLHSNWSDPRINSLWASQRAAFDTALSLLPIPGQRIAVPTDDGFTIETILYRSGLPGPRPTIIMGTGYDGCQEELYHGWVLGALERGYNVLTYEGPGQPTVRREQNVGFIPNWEAVISPLVDFLTGQYSSTAASNSTVTNTTAADVDISNLADPQSIGLLGVSFGGYLAPRAASVEHRLAAVMAVDGVVTPGESILNELPTALISLFNSGNQTYFDAYIEAALNGTTIAAGERWGIQQGEWAFHTHSAYDWLKQMQDYNMTAEIAASITTPTFTADAENDIFYPGQGSILAGLLTPGLATYHYFSAASGAGAHCSLGAQVMENEVVFGWFDSIVTNKTSTA